MNKNICFIANYYKTDVFIEIAKALQPHSITTYWIIPNRKQFNSLKQIFPEHQLLYIGKKEVLASQLEPLDFDLKVNELVYGDRVLREESKRWSYDYLLKIQPIVYTFLNQNKISFVFGEVTWAHELIVHRLITAAKDLNCQFLNPHTIRIPNGRFAFFTDEFQSKIKEVLLPSENETSKIKLEKPSYLAINDKLLLKKGTLKYNIKLLKNFLFRTNQDSNDPTLYSNMLIQFRIRIAELYNRLIFKYFVRETAISDLPPNYKKVLFTLHKQPEASIDVIGRYYEDQMNLIINVWRILPNDYILLVKEHSNAIGDRNLNFYKRIKHLRNTFLINNKSDSHKLLEEVEAVFTVSGTIAYEAALKNRKGFTFAPTFFNKLNHCIEVSWKDFAKKQIQDLSKEKPQGLEINEFSSWLIKNSFQGIMSDSYGDPRSMQIENIDDLSTAFLTIINT